MQHKSKQIIPDGKKQKLLFKEEPALIYVKGWSYLDEQSFVLGIQ